MKWGRLHAEAPEDETIDVRRVKMGYLDPRNLLAILSGRASIVLDCPDDAQMREVFSCPERGHAWGILVYHPSFDRVLDGSLIPELGVAATEWTDEFGDRYRSQGGEIQKIS